MSSEIVCTHLSKFPDIDPSAFVVEGAALLGDVRIGPDSSIWYQCVLRADIESIEIGRGTNIQDATVIHLASDRGTKVGDYVTVGHRALLHACTIEDEVLVGMGAILMDGSVIGRECIVAAGSLVTKGFEAPAGSLVMGSPARVVRPLQAEERAGIRHWAEKYIEVSREHRAKCEATRREG
ncbi:MAG: gamma carbonic anhydrase family protein [Verrucomicrobiota bacterium]